MYNNYAVVDTTRRKRLEQEHERFMCQQALAERIEALLETDKSYEELTEEDVQTIAQIQSKGKQRKLRHQLMHNCMARRRNQRTCNTLSLLMDQVLAEMARDYQELCRRP
jgi:hypothetical protein